MIKTITPLMFLLYVTLSGCASSNPDELDIEKISKEEKAYLKLRYKKIKKKAKKEQSVDGDTLTIKRSDIPGW